MSFDGLFLSKMIEELSVIKGGRVNKINQIFKYDFVFVCRSNGKNHKLYFNATPDSARVQFTSIDYIAPITPSNFTLFLRKNLEGAIIKDVVQHKSDRIFKIIVTKVSDLGFIETKYIIFEVMGRHSNLILTDEEYRIIDAFRHINPFDNANRTIFPNAIYNYPSSRKESVFDANDKSIYNNAIDIQEKYEGISKQTAQEIVHRGISIKKFLQLEVMPISIIDDTTQAYYYIDVTHKKGTKTLYKNLSDMLDIFYFERDQVVRNVQKSGNLLKSIESKIKRNTKKIKKFKIDLDNANNSDDYRIIGELIYSNMHLIKKGDKSIILDNFYTNEKQKIVLDARLSPQKNGELYFKRYNKLKKSITHINEQIEIAKEENKYLELVRNQVISASLEDLDEIKEELISTRMLKNVHSGKTKKRKKINYKIYEANDGTKIYVGKNNIQNEYLTHKNAKPNEVWMHVKESPSSHVIIKDSQENVSEDTLRLAANICAYNSIYKNSSSVAIDYTKAKFVKKIPGKASCFVRYTNQKTIYIDPDEKLIISLKNLNK